MPVADNKDLTEWVDLFDIGVHKGKLYTGRDLRALVRNFYRFRSKLNPPAVIGHSEDQEWLKDTGLPAVGWLAQVRLDGTKVQGRFARMPPFMRRLLEVGAYGKLSPEIYHEDSPPEGIDADGVMFRRIAFLGGELPHIKSLRDVTALWDRDPRTVRGHRHKQALAYAERVHLPGGTWAVFYEVTKMADDNDLDLGEGGSRQHQIDNLLAAGVPQTEIDALAAVDDAAFSDWAVARLAGLAGVTDTDIVEEEPITLAEPEAMGRDELIAELAAMGEDPAVLEGMSDEELREMYRTMKGEAMSEGKRKAKGKRPAAAATFSEKRIRELEARLAAAERQASLSLASKKKNNVTSFCESMVKQGKLTPAQAEPGKGPVWRRLMRADAVRGVAKFGEQTVTELDMQMKEIEASGPVRRYGVEQVADPLEQSEDSDVIKQATEYAAQRNKRLGVGRN